MKRPNKKDYNFNDNIDSTFFAKQMIDYANYLEQKLGEAKKQVKNINHDAVLSAGDSLKTDEFRLHLTEPDELKIVATGVGFDNIRVEPVSANCIIVHAYS